VHTSTISVAVFPEVEDTDVDIKASDLQVCDCVSADGDDVGSCLSGCAVVTTDRYISGVGSRRAARQHDRQRRPHYTHSHGHRGSHPGRALAAQQQGEGDEGVGEHLCWYAVAGSHLRSCSSCRGVGRCCGRACSRRGGRLRCWSDRSSGGSKWAPPTDPSAFERTTSRRTASRTTASACQSA
jgi:hypothetical protein